LKRSFNLYLEDILERISRIREYTNGMTYIDFQRNKLVSDGVVHNLEIIGEIAGQLDDEFRRKHSEVPWQEMKDFRNVIIHKYHKVDFEIVWSIVENLIDPLEKNVQKILL